MSSEHAELEMIEDVDDDNLPDIVLDLEGFDQTFDEINGGWRNLSPTQYLSNKANSKNLVWSLGIATFPSAAYFTGYATTIFGLGIEDMSLDGLLGLGLLFGTMAGGLGSIKAGSMCLEKLQNLEHDFNENFEGVYREVESFEEVEEILENSDKVRYLDTEIPVETYEPSAEDAADDYRELVNLLKSERNYWKTELDSLDYKKLSDAQQDILEAYDPEDDTTDLLDIKELQDLQEHHISKIEDISNMIDETEISQYLRLDKVSNDAYDGTVYQLEVYQGKDLKLALEGLTEQLISRTGREVDFLETV